ncbi:DUF4230 domain-containing protein [Mesobacillus subterraneus]|uniref:DUF4230 domain-containing protein n=1 Tax=Mesobacillus subterraneus TaxID=285983 RepID=UPI00273D5A08|nr:DUF4230 domain-containing protein [Mesobacillus subterraneus]WLR57200.1 DUF4230 domain-containing protein [Mesobacillus subterraneus]
MKAFYVEKSSGIKDSIWHAIAQDQIKQEAIDAGILQKADKNAEIVLKEFFGHLGYKVKIVR